VLGWRDLKPNIADSGSATSLAIATRMFERLGINRISTEPPQTLGSMFELSVRGLLAAELPLLTPGRQWDVSSRPITDFSQYSHLRRVTELLVDADPEGTLRSELGTDYIIKPDITVGALVPGKGSFLHAAVSCKWTIRSDRVQNIRHEGVVLTRHRRGRQPHVITVTMEPLPSRLASIARGTGEVDCVYHADLEGLQSAVSESAFEVELSILEELVAQDRLRPLWALPEVIAVY
jgi:hypothetical protein